MDVNLPKDGAAVGRPASWWTVGVASLAVTLAAVWFRIAATRLCGGEFIYPIDDTYIHIAIAKNLALHGVWGVMPTETAFCSSSPLWTLLLSVFYWLFGVSEILPWYLALGFNLGIVVLVDRLLLRAGCAWFVRLPSALAVAVAAPFFCTTALAMEHAMHGFFLLAAVWALTAEPLERRSLVWGAVFAFCATATRYESLFFLLPFALLLMVATRRRAVAAVLGASVLPVVLYGGWAVACGGHFLPNSLLRKGQFSTLWEIVQRTLHLFVAVPDCCEYLYLLAIPLAAAVVLPGVRRVWRIAAASLLVAVAGQIVFAAVVPLLCRYEAYLTAGGAAIAIAAFATAGPRHVARKAVQAVALVVALAGFGLRVYDEAPATVWSSEDIYSQQVQMTRMMRDLPEEARGCVALNDLGYMSLYLDMPLLDIWGLGSQDMTEVILAHDGMWSPKDLDEAFRRHHARYMVVYEQWFPLERMPPGTIPVAYLHLDDPHICGSDLVAFRAFTPEDATRLAKHLSAYVDRLPRRAAMKIVWQPPKPPKPLCAR